MVEVFNTAGQIDLSKIRDADVALLSEDQRTALATLYDAVQAKTAADARKATAIKLVRELMKIEEDAAAAHAAASPPPTFQQIHAANAAAYSAYSKR
jgi:hypothetical protein